MDDRSKPEIGVRPKVLVTGAAGYIGTHVVQALITDGWTKDNLLGIDDFRTSAKSNLLDQIQFFNESVYSVDQMVALLVEHQVDSIIHLAGNRFARLSLSDPFKAYSENLIPTLIVSESAKQSGRIQEIIFSSSCAVYGSSDEVLNEESSVNPTSPYGHSKLWGEQILIDHWRSGGVLPIILRYFNVIGWVPPASEDRNPNGLVGAIIRAAQTGEPLKVFGNDFNTSDGTAIRDLISVQDVANAHVQILKSERSKRILTPQIFNLGSGVSVSVQEFISEAEVALGKKLRVEYVGRDPADPAIVRADGSRFQLEYNWTPTSNLRTMIAGIGLDQI